MSANEVIHYVSNAGLRAAGIRNASINHRDYSGFQLSGDKRW
jgi:hypothetical protein